jgi:plasmid stability protein
MATLTVRNLDEEIVRRLRIQAAEHGRSAEAEHREILRATLIAGSQAETRQQAADRLDDFRRRTGGRNSTTGTELLAESRSERLRSLTGKDPS